MRFIIYVRTPSAFQTIYTCFWHAFGIKIDSDSLSLYPLITNMASLKAFTKAAGVAIINAQKEAFDAVHKLLEEFEDSAVRNEVMQALEELTAKFTAGKPKRAKTGYNLFIAEHMKESKANRQLAGESDLKSVDHMKLACAAWKELGDDEQEKYREMARELVCSTGAKEGASTSDSDTVTVVEPVSQAKAKKPKAKKEIAVEDAKAKKTKAKKEVVQDDE